MSHIAITNTVVNVQSQKERAIAELAIALQMNAQAVSDLAKAIEKDTAPSYGIYVANKD